jgi:hypothetical protein
MTSSRERLQFNRRASGDVVFCIVPVSDGTIFERPRVGGRDQEGEPR